MRLTPSFKLVVHQSMQPRPHQFVLSLPLCWCDGWSTQGVWFGDAWMRQCPIARNSIIQGSSHFLVLFSEVLFSSALAFFLHKTLTNRITHFLLIVWVIPALLALNLWGTWGYAGGPSSKLLRETFNLRAALARFRRLFGFGACPISVTLFPIGVNCSMSLFRVFRSMAYCSMDR